MKGVCLQHLVARRTRALPCSFLPTLQSEQSIPLWERRARVVLRVVGIDENPELEAAIHDAPGDETVWVVYSDWLQQVGDPRGELIALHVHTGKEKAKRHAARHDRELWDKAK